MAQRPIDRLTERRCGCVRASVCVFSPKSNAMPLHSITFRYTASGCFVSTLIWDAANENGYNGSVESGVRVAKLQGSGSGGGEKAYILLKLFVSRAIVLDYLRWDIARARIFRFMVLGRIFFGCAKITISVWWHVMGFSDNWMALVSNSVVLVVHVGSNTIAASNSNFMDEYLNIQIDWWSFWEFQRRRLWMFNEIIQQLC